MRLGRRGEAKGLPARRAVAEEGREERGGLGEGRGGVREGGRRRKVVKERDWRRRAWGWIGWRERMGMGMGWRLWVLWVPAVVFADSNVERMRVLVLERANLGGACCVSLCGVWDDGRRVWDW